MVASEGYRGPSRGHSGWSPAPVGINLRAMTTTAPTSETPSVSSPPRRFLRSHRDRFLGGVCGGLGEHTGIDSTVWRVGFVAFTIAGGAGILAYLLLWVLMPPGQWPEGQQPGKLDRLADQAHEKVYATGWIPPKP